MWSGLNTITRNALVAQDKVCSLIATRGLNLINLRLWNDAAIAKLCWDVANKAYKLWVRWIHNI